MSLTFDHYKLFNVYSLMQIANTAFDTKTIALQQSDYSSTIGVKGFNVAALF